MTSHGHILSASQLKLLGSQTTGLGFPVLGNVLPWEETQEATTRRGSTGQQRKVSEEHCMINAVDQGQGKGGRMQKENLGAW